MSEEVKMECGMCGQSCPTDPECPLCHGNNARYLQTRSYTLTEERQGMKSDSEKDRYGRMGEVNPRLVVLPGGFDPSRGKSEHKD